ncbi:Transmembrane protease serine 3 [Eumeta japonica]|uniref:Transmembrane protease serine 3 n=1 Tax=Eumeta variegata TaxID=151549 RepID=A0A4C1VTE3_EUMVA|nr:Transmembrane protease serine 3 [Eumeta japonica]
MMKLPAINMMKLLIIVLILKAVFADVDLIENNTAYGYFEKFGIPEANRIRAIEEKYVEGGARIVGGTSTNLGQYPWQAGLIIDFATIDGRGVCGASLISPDRLVTAAHCWFDGRNQASKYTVVLGSTFLFYGGERFVTNIVVTHPRWIPLLVRNDIAIIYLTSPVSFSDILAPISLPEGDEDVYGYAIASGFGLTSDMGSIDTEQFLSHVTLQVISNSLCRWAFPGVVQDSHICTSGLGGVGACGGDSGGPLFTTSNDRTVLIGVTSFGSALGCSAGLPTVYTRITSYIDFIQQHLE